MNEFVAFALTTALALEGVNALAAPVQKPSVLYDQNSNFGQGIVSDNFTSAPSYDSIAADDFWVPAGGKWLVTEVDVSGAYVSGSGPASSVVVTFWTGAFPQRIAQKRRDSFTLTCADNNGSFACVLPLDSSGKPVVQLRGGATGKRYWVSVVANCDFTSCGEWEWTTSTVVHDTEAEWKNPGGGWDTPCGDGWGTVRACFNLPPTDFAFTLLGYSR